MAAKPARAHAMRLPREQVREILSLSRFVPTVVARSFPVNFPPLAVITLAHKRHSLYRKLSSVITLTSFSSFRSHRHRPHRQ